VVSTRQARSFGVNRQYLARSQRWKWVSPGLYRLAAIPTSWRAQLMGAVLAGGHPTLASHRSAALLWGLDGVSEELIEVTMPRNRNRIRICSDPVIVHRSTHLDSVDAYTRDNIPVTGVTRTLIDLASVVDRETLESALESGLRMSQTSLRDLRRRLAVLGGRGKSGTATLRAVLADREDSAPTESELETRFVQLCRRGGLGVPLRQYPVFTDRLVARCDFAFVDAGVLIELDGYARHSSPADHQRDLTRQNALMLARVGWIVLRYSWNDVVHESAKVVSDLRQALDR
jgi:very-short-patch-repair endonuclease